MIGVSDPLHGITPGPLPAGLAPGGFLFAPLGADPRKNLPAAVLTMAELARRRVHLDLVILSHPPHEHRHELDLLAHSVGWHPRHIVAVSDLGDDELVALYRDAALTLMPSYDEGFSTPVIESVGRGTAVVASEHPVHVELVGEGWWLAPPDDVRALADAVQRGLAESAELLERQRRAIGDRFEPSTIGETLRDRVASTLRSADRPVEVDVLATPARPHLAMVTPWPPSASGVATYHHLTAAALCERVDLTVFSLTDRPIDHGNYRELPLTDPDYRDPGITHRVIVLGNSHYHVPALELLRGFGGAVVSHDQRMTDIYREWQGPHVTADLLADGLDRPHVDDLDRHSTGGTGERLGYREIAALAEPLLVHSRQLADLVRTRQGVEPVVLPFASTRSLDGVVDAERRRGVRAALGLDPDRLHIAAFGGHNIGYKGTGVVIAATAWLAGWGLRPQLHLAGGCPPAELERLRALIEDEGIADSVTLHGYLDEATFDALHIGVDVAVQLRLDLPGQVSGALADTIAFGLPTVATTALADALEAPDFVERVDAPVSPFLVAEAVARLARTRDQEPERIERARTVYLAERNPIRYAEALLAAIGIEGIDR